MATHSKKPVPLSFKLSQKRELQSICNSAIEKALKQGQLKQPGSLRNLRRWLTREVVKKEGWRAGPERVMKTATILLMLSGLFISITPTAEAATFNEIVGTSNPLDGVNIGFYAIPTLADIDSDGDLDAFIGEDLGTMAYFENTGSAATPVYVQRTGATNPFDGFAIGRYLAPTFTDIDADGDLDTFFGESDGVVKYFENTGSAESPAFAERTGASNPFNGIDVGERATPAFSDIDSDGDIDAFIGEYMGTLKYFENTGNASNPTFVERTGIANPLNLVDVPTEPTPTFADIDFDGDLDAFIGEFSQNIYYFENTGDATNPVFIERTGSNNPLENIFGDTDSNIAPTFSDIDADGDADLFVGEHGGEIFFFENSSTYPSREFVEITGAPNPLDGVDIGRYSTVIFVDIDSDGDLDMFNGEYDGSMKYFENTGDAKSPVFAERTGTLNPLDGFLFNDFESVPTFADLDADGDLDAFAGEYYGTLKYYENTGSAETPSFVEQTGVNNPLDGIDIGYSPSPTFTDIDSDGDMDIFIGEFTGIVFFYENTGSAETPTYTERTGSANPFNGLDVGFRAHPTFTDIDFDGDLDALVGESIGTIKYFENTGSIESAVFTQRTGILNPLNNIDVGDQAMPTFTDIDLDGDADLFIGNELGSFSYFESNRAPMFTNTSVINGTATAGELLSLANTEVADADGDTVTFSYQWKADGVDIIGATSATFVSTTDEVGASVTATITADDGNGGITSTTTASVTPSGSANTGTGGGGSLNWMSLLLMGLLLPFKRLTR